MAVAQLVLESAEQAFMDQVIAGKVGTPGALLGILEAVQEHHPNKYLPAETLRYIAGKLDIPLARIYSVATFYALFNLEPQGDNTICICRGTACHTRNSRAKPTPKHSAWIRKRRRSFRVVNWIPWLRRSRYIPTHCWLKHSPLRLIHWKSSSSNSGWIETRT